jgi:hypothetical protein
LRVDRQWRAHTGITFGTGSDINTLNAMSIGTSYNEAHPVGPSQLEVPQAIDFQVAASGANPSRVATIWTTDQGVGGTDCIFTAQAFTTGV